MSSWAIRTRHYVLEQRNRNLVLSEATTRHPLAPLIEASGMMDDEAIAAARSSATDLESSNEPLSALVPTDDDPLVSSASGRASLLNQKMKTTSPIAYFQPEEIAKYAKKPFPTFQFILSLSKPTNDPGEEPEEKVKVTYNDLVVLINRRHREMKEAWERSQHRKVLKIMIQLTKVLNDGLHPDVFPRLFSLLCRSLDQFGAKVYKQLLDASFENGEDMSLGLSRVKDEAKEYFQFWLYKISACKDLLTRILLEAAILKSFCLLLSNPYIPTLRRLFHMCNGISNPMLAAYVRSYVLKKGMEVGMDDRKTVIDNFIWFWIKMRKATTYRLYQAMKLEKIDFSHYQRVYSPCIQIHIASLLQLQSGATSSRNLIYHKLIPLLLHAYRDMGCNTVVLHHMLELCPSAIISANAEKIVEALSGDIILMAALDGNKKVLPTKNSSESDLDEEDMDMDSDSEIGSKPSSSEDGMPQRNGRATSFSVSDPSLASVSPLISIPGQEAVPLAQLEDALPPAAYDPHALISNTCFHLTQSEPDETQRAFIFRELLLLISKINKSCSNYLIHIKELLAFGLKFCTSTDLTLLFDDVHNHYITSEAFKRSQLRVTSTQPSDRIFDPRSVPVLTSPLAAGNPLSASASASSSSSSSSSSSTSSSSSSSSAYPSSSAKPFSVVPSVPSRGISLFSNTHQFVYDKEIPLILSNAEEVSPSRSRLSKEVLSSYEIITPDSVLSSSSEISTVFDHTLGIPHDESVDYDTMAPDDDDRPDPLSQASSPSSSSSSPSSSSSSSPSSSSISPVPPPPRTLSPKGSLKKKSGDGRAIDNDPSSGSSSPLLPDRVFSITPFASSALTSSPSYSPMGSHTSLAAPLKPLPPPPRPDAPSLGKKKALSAASGAAASSFGSSARRPGVKIEKRAESLWERQSPSNPYAASRYSMRVSSSPLSDSKFTSLSGFSASASSSNSSSAPHRMPSLAAPNFSQMDNFLSYLYATPLEEPAPQQKLSEEEILLFKVINGSCRSAEKAAYVAQSYSFQQLFSFMAEEQQMDCGWELLNSIAKPACPCITDPLSAYFLFKIAQKAFRSINSFTPDDLRRQADQILLHFASKINFGKGIEQQIAFYVEMRRSFQIFEMLNAELIYLANTLTMKSFMPHKTRRHRRALNLMKGCIAFSQVSIPSIASIPLRLRLLLNTLCVSLAVGLLSHVEVMVKMIISLLMQYPETKMQNGEAVSTEHDIVEFLSQFISILLVLPSHPPQAPFAIVRAVRKYVNDKRWKVESCAKGMINCNILALLTSLAQKTYIYHVRDLESNDVLKATDTDYKEDLMYLFDDTVSSILFEVQRLKDVAAVEAGKSCVALIIHFIETGMVFCTLNLGLAQDISKLFKILKTKVVELEHNHYSVVITKSDTYSSHVKNIIDKICRIADTDPSVLSVRLRKSILKLNFSRQ